METINKKNGTLHEFLDMMEAVFTSAVVVLLMFTFIFRIVSVDGSSMNNTLMDEDKLITTHLLYKPEAGDIVVLNSDLEEYERLIKRVIAISGQTIDIEEASGKVIVDGEYINEPYVKGLTSALSNYDYPITIPDGYVFVMGDNREHSTDSRDELVGFVNVDDILGKAVLRFLPFSSFGKID